MPKNERKIKINQPYKVKEVSPLILNDSKIWYIKQLEGV